MRCLALKQLLLSGIAHRCSDLLIATDAGGSWDRHIQATSARNAVHGQQLSCDAQHHESQVAAQ
jgi:hypothetical protein